MRLFLAASALFAATLAVSPAAETVTEPRTGVAFAVKEGDLTLLGVGAKTKTFLKVKIYGAGFYVADSALTGALAAHRGRPVTAALYRDVITGDFPKLMILRWVRNATVAQIREGLREALAAADPAPREKFIGFFGDTRSGDEYRIRWAPGGVVEVSVNGQARPPIPDRAFAVAAFGSWLGDEAQQQDLRRALVSRAPLVLR